MQHMDPAIRERSEHSYAGALSTIKTCSHTAASPQPVLSQFRAMAETLVSKAHAAVVDEEYDNALELYSEVRAPRAQRLYPNRYAQCTHSHQ